MANSDYIAKTANFGFCPTATLVGAIGPLDAAAVMTDFSASFTDALRIGMAAMIDGEIVSIVAASGNNLTLGRGCCDTVPVAHADGSIIWFFDDSIGSVGTEYAGSETVSVKMLPRTSGGGAIPIEHSPPKQVGFNFRFARPYPPGQVMVNGLPFTSNLLMQEGLETLTLTWVHRNRVTQQDQLIPHEYANITPEVGTTYIARVYRADDVLVWTSSPIIGTEWSYEWGYAALDSGYTTGTRSGYIKLWSVRDGLESFQAHRIDFQYDALNAPPLVLGLNFEQADGSVVMVDTSRYADHKTITAGASVRTAAARYGSAGLRIDQLLIDAPVWEGDRFNVVAGKGASIEFWFKPISTPNYSFSPALLYVQDLYTGSAVIEAAVYGTGGLNIRFDQVFNDFRVYPYTPDANGWVQAVICIGPYGGARLYLNQTLVVSRPNTEVFSTGNVGTPGYGLRVAIGRMAGGPNAAACTCYFDTFKFSMRDKYSAGVPVPPPVHLLLHMDGTNGSQVLVDSSDYGNHPTVVGSGSLDSSQQKFGATSWKGVPGSYFQTDVGSFGLISGDFTLEFFCRTGSNTVVFYSVLGGGYLYNGSFQSYGGPALALSEGSTYGDVWNHCVIARQGSTMRSYKAGVQQGAVTYSGNVDLRTLRWGTYVPNNNTHFQGHLDEIRLWVGDCLYPDGTTFTPPTGPF